MSSKSQEFFIIKKGWEAWLSWLSACLPEMLKTLGSIPRVKNKKYNGEENYLSIWYTKEDTKTKNTRSLQQMGRAGKHSLL